MSYNSSIPQAASKRVISQKQIKANFTAIYNAFAKNHLKLGPPDTQGKHNILILRPQGADPATTANQTAIYNKLVATIPNLFYRPNNNQTPIQMTYPSINVSSALSQQYSFVAGPFVVYGGLISNPMDGDVINLAITGPATTLRTVLLCSRNFSGVSNLPGGNLLIGWAIPTNIAGTSFTIRFEVHPGQTRDVQYLAIGN
jgi:hypothetical protein